MDTINIALIGDHETGKTSFCRRLLTGEFMANYHHIPTKKYDYKHIIESEDESITVSISFNDYYGCNVQEIIDDNTQYDACIIFYTSDSDHTLTDETLNEFLKKNLHAKIVICWTKTDTIEEQKKIKKIIHKKGYEYLKRYYSNVRIYQISCRSNYNLYEPINTILNELSID